MKKATQKMIDYAIAISRNPCNHKELESFDYDYISNFINENKKAYEDFIKTENLLGNFFGEVEKLEENFETLDFNYYEYLMDFLECKGIYIFYHNEKIIYIGKSRNLGLRIVQSLNERLHEYRGINKISFLTTESEFKYHIEEILLVSKYKPLLNIEFKVDNDSKYKTEIVLEDCNKNYFWEKDVEEYEDN